MPLFFQRYTVCATIILLLAGVVSAHSQSGVKRTLSSPAEAVWAQYGGPSRNFVAAQPIGEIGKPVVLWKRTLGQGTSGIVSNGKSLFTMYSLPDPKDINKGEEFVVALDRETGETRWKHVVPVAMLKGQESFSRDPIRPQATPALIGNCVCTLGFTGLLKCFDADSGRLLWQHELVQEFAATPVQFGFSASPLVLGNAFIVHVGGKRASLIAFSAQDGTVKWQSESAEPSYASPVVLRREQEDHIVQVTRDAILGVSARDGRTLWRYPMPKTGLTNVPTPIPLGKERLLISGQGVLGTRLLQLSQTSTGFQVKEVWRNLRTSFFYCNWTHDNEAVYGAVSGFVGALSLANGKELWRERGQNDANHIRIGEETLLLRGDGLLTRCKMSPTGLTTTDTFQLLQGRCWTPPTLLESTLYARDDREIVALRLF